MVGILDALKPPVDNLVKDVLAYIDEVIHKLIERQLRGRFPKLVGLFCEQVFLEVYPLRMEID